MKERERIVGFYTHAKADHEATGGNRIPSHGRRVRFFAHAGGSKNLGRTWNHRFPFEISEKSHEMTVGGGAVLCPWGTDERNSGPRGTDLASPARGTNLTSPAARGTDKPTCCLCATRWYHFFTWYRERAIFANLYVNSFKCGKVHAHYHQRKFHRANFYVILYFSAIRLESMARERELHPWKQMVVRSYWSSFDLRKKSFTQLFSRELFLDHADVPFMLSSVGGNVGDPHTFLSVIPVNCRHKLQSKFHLYILHIYQLIPHVYHTKM